jgi:tetratricopeptide (TPR) repeat protein
VFESDTRPGSEAIDAARKRRPVDADAIMVDACLRARGGRPDSASQLVARELTRRDPDVARLASACVITGTMAAARDRIQADDVEGAKTIAALAIAAIDDPAARSQFERIQSALASGTKIVFHDEEAASPQQTAADAALSAYNEAVDLGNAGRSDEALARLDAIAAACSDPDICERAKQAASRLRPVVTRNRWVKRYNDAVTLSSSGKYKDAIAVFRELEKEIDDPELLAGVRKMLHRLGEKPAP